MSSNSPQASSTQLASLMKDERWDAASLAAELKKRFSIERSYNTIRNWMLGKSDPSVVDGIRVSEIIGKPVTDVFGDRVYGGQSIS